MKKVNKKAIKKLCGASSSLIRANSKVMNSFLIVDLSLLTIIQMIINTTSTSAQLNDRANDCGCYSYVKYNPNWGNKESAHLLNISVTKNNLGVAKMSDAPKELLAAIYECLGENKVKNSNHKYVTFDIVYEKENDSYIIDRKSFKFYSKNNSNFGNLTDRNVFLPIIIFDSPEGPRWINEQNYIEYLKDKNVVYQCSDGSLVSSYFSFKDREIELSKPKNYSSLSSIYSKSKSLDNIDLLEACSDGTIWSDGILLNEYLSWRRDNSSNYRNGIYCGSYGQFTSFEEYMNYYNVAYFASKGLSPNEQYRSPDERYYFLLFSTQKQAAEYAKNVKIYQKK